MRIVKKHTFGPVQAYELGYSPIGRPFMSVYFYFIDSILIDTGQSHMRKEILEIVKGHTIEKVLLTHHHEDHSGNAKVISDQYNIPVFGHPLTVQKMKKSFRILPYQHIIWGLSQPLEMSVLPEIIENESHKLKPIHTPGHSKDHTVYWEKEHGWLFSGDLYLADKIKYFRVDEKINEQIDSLKKVLLLDFDTIFCAHFPKLKNGKIRMASKLQFLEDLYGNVANLWQQGNNAAEIMSTLEIKEKTIVKWFCTGNVSAINGIRSVIKSQC